MIITVTLNTAIDHVVEVNNLKTEQINQGELKRLAPAGKAVNVACVLGALGVPCIAAGFVGTDDMDFFRHTLEGLDVQCPPKPNFTAVAGRTRMNTTLIDPSRDRETHIRESGFETTAVEKKALSQAVDSLTKPGDTVVISGSFPRGYTTDDLHELIDMLNKKGAHTLVDCSSSGAGSWMKKPLWAIMVNREELSQALDRKVVGFDAFVAAARELTSRAEFVLASDGPAGAVAVMGDRAIHGCLELPAEKVINTVGAGDSFVAGFIAGWTQTGDMESAMRLSQATAVSKVMHPGSSEINPGFIWDSIAKVKIAEV